MMTIDDISELKTYRLKAENDLTIQIPLPKDLTGESHNFMSQHICKLRNRSDQFHL